MYIYIYVLEIAKFIGIQTTITNIRYTNWITHTARLNVLDVDAWLVINFVVYNISFLQLYFHFYSMYKNISEMPISKLLSLRS